MLLYQIVKQKPMNVNLKIQHKCHNIGLPRTTTRILDSKLYLIYQVRSVQIMDKSNSHEMTVYVDQKHINNQLIKYLDNLSKQQAITSDDIPLLCFVFERDANNTDLKVAKISFGFTHDINEICFTSCTFTACLDNVHSILESKILFKTYLNSLIQLIHSDDGFIESLKANGITTFAFNNDFSDTKTTMEMIF